MINKIRRLLEKNKIINRLINDYYFKTVIFSSFSFLFGIAYAIFNIFVAGLSHSLWCGALACFYMLLIFLRGYLILDIRKIHKTTWNDEKQKNVYEAKKYRLCGIIFIVMTLCLSAMITLIVKEEKTFEYPLIIVYVIAGYTLFRIGVSIYNYIKASRYDNFTIRSLRCINLVTALSSFLSLQSIALNNFSKNVNIPIANALTGGVICLFIVVLGVFMVVSSTGMIKVIKTYKN